MIQAYHTVTRSLANVFFILCLFALAHCNGSVQNTEASGDSSGNGDTSGSDDNGGSEDLTATAVLFSTDFSSPGELLTTSTAVASLSATKQDNSSLGSDGSLVVDDSGILHIVFSAFSSFSSDNITTLDPTSSFATTSQFSTGNGTNPTDAVVVGTTAYISLYNGDSDATNVDASGNPADVLIMDLGTGAINSRLSFFPFTQDDSDRHANASKMVSDSANDTLYVLMQDLNSDFSVTAPGQIIEIDTSNNTIVKMQTLQGRNPVYLSGSDDARCLFVANQAEFSNTTSTFDTSTAFGGIETVCEDGTDVLVDDALLGGYVEKVVANDTTGKLYAVASNLNADFSSTSLIVTLDISDLAAGSTTPAFASFFAPGADIRALAFAPDGNLWVSHREINTETHAVSNPLVSVLDASTGETLGQFETDLPVTAIAFVQ